MMNIKAHGSEENYGIDRISSLPDDVCTRILSFLNTREAVQTCILSKRWINTWASVSDLKFDIKEFGLINLQEIIDDEMAVEELLTKFELLMRSVLEKRETSCINRFQLCLDSGFYFRRSQAVADCIGDVMKLGPREFLVKLCSYENLNLNTYVIFTCASLIYLQLCLSTEVDHFVPIEPNSVKLPCLKTLNLKGVMLSIVSLKKLLLGCPVLEELVLEGCYIDIIEICSNTLKKLVLQSYYYVMRLQISTPNLLYLDISVLDVGEILLLNMPSLVDASIYISRWYEHDKYVTMGPKLIHSLSNVESLRLKFDCPMEKVQKKYFSNCPIFDNLKSQEILLSWGFFFVFDFEPFFIHQSPNLQEVTLKNHALVTEFVDEETTQEGPGDALVQREFLKTIRIVGFKNDNGFVDLLINKLLVHVKIIGEIDIV